MQASIPVPEADLANEVAGHELSPTASLDEEMDKLQLSGPEPIPAELPATPSAPPQPPPEPSSPLRYLDPLGMFGRFSGALTGQRRCLHKPTTSSRPTITAPVKWMAHPLAVEWSFAHAEQSTVRQPMQSFLICLIHFVHAPL